MHIYLKKQKVTYDVYMFQLEAKKLYVIFRKRKQRNGHERDYKTVPNKKQTQNLVCNFKKIQKIVEEEESLS